MVQLIEELFMVFGSLREVVVLMQGTAGKTILEQKPFHVRTFTPIVWPVCEATSSVGGG